MTQIIKISRTPYEELEVDCVVNSANDMLVLGSNVASRIRKAAGGDLEKHIEGIRDKRKNQPFDLGEAVDTPSFNMRKGDSRRLIIHAITMGSRVFAPPSGRLLATPYTVYLACRNSIILADQEGCGSIVFPVMASRPGYSVLKMSENEIRCIMAAAMMLGIMSGYSETLGKIEVIISISDSKKDIEDINNRIFGKLLQG